MEKIIVNLIICLEIIPLNLLLVIIQEDIKTTVTHNNHQLEEAQRTLTTPQPMELPNHKFVPNQNIKTENKAENKMLPTGTKQIHNLLLHPRKLKFSKHMIEDLLDLNYIKASQVKQFEKMVNLIQYSKCQQVWVESRKTRFHLHQIKVEVGNHQDQTSAK